MIARSVAALLTLDAFELQHDPQRGRNLGHVLPAFGNAPQQAGELPPGELRAVLGRQVFSTRIRTSESVVSSMMSGTMIGRGNGRDQFGTGNGAGSSRNATTGANIFMPAKEEESSLAGVLATARARGSAA
jgi:hypothetical protein